MVKRFAFTDGSCEIISSHCGCLSLLIRKNCDVTVTSVGSLCFEHILVHFGLSQQLAQINVSHRNLMCELLLSAAKKR